MRRTNRNLSFATAVLFLTAPALIAASAAGTLKVLPTNPLYFTDGANNPDGSLQ